MRHHEDFCSSAAVELVVVQFERTTTTTEPLKQAERQSYLHVPAYHLVSKLLKPEFFF